MDQHDDDEAPLVPPDAQLPAPAPADEPQLPAPFDPHRVDPAEFEWRPVPRRPRADGWTPDLQRRFIEALADTGMVEAAARAIDMSVNSAYRLRRAPGSEGFARAWEAAVAHAADRLIDIAFTRAIEGVEVPIFDRDGFRLGGRRQYSDRLMMFLLRTYRPDRFRLAHLGDRARDEPPPPAETPIAPAIEAITPPPPDPHLLQSPERLESMVEGARARGEVHDLYPDLHRERFVVPEMEPDHPRAIERRQARYGKLVFDDAEDEDDYP